MIPVTKIYLPHKDRYFNFIKQIYKSGKVTTNGPFKKKLEKKLEKFFKVKNVILVANGSLALQIAYKALDLTGNVITTPFSYIATSSTLLWEKLEPNFVDIDKKTLNIDVNIIEKKINNKTSAILPVHVFGNPCEVDSIKKIANKYNLKIIYDASHAFNTKYKNTSVLRYGDVSIVSLQATKIFHTIEGGAIITNNNKLANKIRRLSNFGFNQDKKILEVGINANMNEFEAAMGLCVLEDFKKITNSRKKIWNFYHQNLKNNFSFQDLNLFANNNYSYFPIILKSEKQTKLTIKNLKEKNIFVRRYFYPSLDLLKFNQKFGICPHSIDISKRIICLPLYYELSKLTQIKIINLLIKLKEKN